MTEFADTGYDYISRGKSYKILANQEKRPFVVIDPSKSQTKEESNPEESADSKVRVGQYL